MASAVPPPPPPPNGMPATYQQPANPPSAARPPSHHASQSQRPGGHSRHHHDKGRSHDKHAAHKHKAPPPAPPQPPPSNEAAALAHRLRRDTPFLANIRFKNDLPEVPGDPKLLVSQQPPDKLAAFSLTAIEKEPKHDLMLPPDLGITLSVLDMDRYAVPQEKPALHPDDLKLLGAEADTLLLSSPLAGVSKSLLGQASPIGGIKRATNLRSAAEVSWLMRTTYLSADADSVRAKREMSEHETRRNKPKAPGSEDIEEQDEEAQRQAQIRMIESTFAATRQPPVHPTKKGMRPIEIMEVLPDVDWWSHKFMIAHFDKDPAQDMEELTQLNNEDLAKQVVSLGVLKGFKLEDEAAQGSTQARNDGRFMALLLPRDVKGAAELLQTEGNSGLAAEQVEGEFDWAREYSYDLSNRKKDAERAPNAPNSQQAYLLRFQGGKALYCEVNSTLELRGKREGGALRSANQQFQRPSKVLVRKRAASTTELEEAKRRRHALRAAAGEDEGDAQGGDAAMADVGAGEQEADDE